MVCGVAGYSLHKLLEIDDVATASGRGVGEGDNLQLVVGKVADLIALSAGFLSFELCSLYVTVILSGNSTDCMDTGTRIMVRFIDMRTCACSYQSW